MALSFHYNVYGCFRDPAADVDLAAAAVDAGFEGVWIGDHFMPWIDSRPYTHHVLPWLGAARNELPEVPLGTSVTCPMLRYRPPVLAQGLATLASLAPGQLHLGVGVGEAVNEAHFVDEWPDWETRAEMLVETLDLFDTLWSADGYVSHHGDHFDYDRIRLYTQPESPIETHWAAWGPKSSYYAGKHADHLLTAASADRIAEQVVPNLERGLAAAGRDLSDVDVTTEFSANVGDPDALVAEIRDAGEHVPADTELDNPDPRSVQRVADTRLAEMSDAEVRDANNVTDDPADLVEELERLADAGVTRVLVGSNCGDPHRTIEAFADHVIPAFE